MSRYYVLDERGNPQEVSVSEWVAQVTDFQANRVVLDKLPGGVMVSTVFLGMDHRFFGSGPPILWETMIFGGEHDQWQERYSSREMALQGHKKAVQLAAGERL